MTTDNVREGTLGSYNKSWATHRISKMTDSVGTHMYVLYMSVNSLINRSVVVWITVIRRTALQALSIEAPSLKHCCMSACS